MKPDIFKTKNNCRRLLRQALCASLVTLPLAATAVDILPGQGVPPPPEISSFTLSLGQSQTGDKYAHGQKLGLGTRIDNDTLALRYGRSFTLADYPASFYIQPAFGRANPGGSLAALDSVSGWKDTTAAFAVWLYSDHDSGRYFGLANYWILPTGNYASDRLINPGLNRYSSALQVAYQSRLTRTLDGMIATDVHWFGANDDYRLTHQKYEQRPLYSVQGTLMYHLNAASMLAASYYQHTGGQDRLDGVVQNSTSKRSRYQLALTGNTRMGKFILQYGQDLTVDNGFKEDRQIWLRHEIAWK